MSARIFISLRFGEAMEEAKLLKAALEISGVPTFLCDVPEGERIPRIVSTALVAAELVVILGTATYGRDTGAGFSTCEEMWFVKNQKKPFFPIQMCERFLEPETLLLFASGICFFPWTPGTPLPKDLVPRIVDKLASLPAPPPPCLLPDTVERKRILAELLTTLRKRHGKILAQRHEQRANLEVYVPLRFSLQKPPLPSGSKGIPLDQLMRALLRGAQEDVQRLVGGAHPPRAPAPRMILLQGTAGTGKSLFGWHMMQYWDQQSAEYQSQAHIPVVINLPEVVDQVRAALATDSGAMADTVAEHFLVTEVLKAYDIPGLVGEWNKLSAFEQAEVYDQPFVFVLDGVDELVDKLPLHRLYSLSRWSNSFFVVCCRTGFFSDDWEAVQFLSGPQSQGSMRGIHLLPFDAAQVDQYIEAFAAKEQGRYGWSAREYQEALSHFAGLREFAQEPLMLYLTLNVMPLMSQRENEEEGCLRLDPFCLQVCPRSELPYVYPVFKRAELYSLFAHSWAEREAIRYRKTIEEDRKNTEARKRAKNSADPDFVAAVLEFCQKLAFEMFLHDKTQVTIVDAKHGVGSVSGSSGSTEAAPNVALAGAQTQTPKKKLDRRAVNALRAQQQQDVTTTPAVTDAFVASILEGHEDEFRCSPLKKSGHVYSFLHKTVQEFFVAMHITRQLATLNYEDRGGFESTLLSGDLSLAIARQLVTAGNVMNTLRFCGELVDPRTQYYVSCGPVMDRDTQMFMAQGELQAVSPYPFGDLQPSSRALWDIVQASRLPQARQHPATAVAAANAMMILNASGVVFDGCDFSFATLGPTTTPSASDATLRSSSVACQGTGIQARSTIQHVFMDISGGVFSNTDFSGAILSEARMDGCSFAKANLVGATLRDVSLGQMPLLLGHTNWVTSVCVTTDRKYILSGSFDNTVRLWSVDSGEQVRVLQGHSNWVTSVCVTVDGKYIVSGSFDNTVRLWSVDSGEQVRVLQGHTDRVTSVCITADGKYIVSGSDDQTVRVWSVESGEQVRVLRGHTGWVNSVCVTVDGKHIVSGSKDKTVRVWSLEAGDEERVLQGHTTIVTSVCVTADGKHVVSGSDDKTVRVWSLEDGDEERVLQGITGAVICVCVTGDGKHIVSGSGDYTVRVWSLESGEQVRVLQGHTGTVNSVCVTADGKHIVSGSDDKTVRVWSMESGDQMRVLHGHTFVVTRVCVTADGNHIVSGAGDTTVRMWSLESGEQVRVMHGHTDGVSGVCVTADEKHIVSGSYDKTVRVWSVESGEQVRVLEGHTDTINSVCVTADGKHIISGSDDKTVRVWSLESGEQVHLLQGQGPVRSVCVTPDGKHIVSGSEDKTVRVWSVESGEQVRVLQGHTDWVNSVCVTADGKHIVCGSFDKTVRVWSIESGEQVHVLQGHTEGVTSVFVTANGRHIVSGSWDKTVRVWSMESGEQLRVLQSHTEPVWTVCVTADGKHIVSGSFDNTIRVWSVEKGSFLRSAGKLELSNVTSHNLPFSDEINAPGIRIFPSIKVRMLRCLGNQRSLTFKDCCVTGAVGVSSSNAMLMGQLGAWAVGANGKKVQSESAVELRNVLLGTKEEEEEEEEEEEGDEKGDDDDDDDDREV